MPKSHAAYAPEFRRQMVELVRCHQPGSSNRVPPSRTFVPLATAIASMPLPEWMNQHIVREIDVFALQVADGAGIMVGDHGDRLLGTSSGFG
jgi:hypothetical protein